MNPKTTHPIAGTPCETVLDRIAAWTLALAKGDRDRFRTDSARLHNALYDLSAEVLRAHAEAVEQNPITGPRMTRISPPKEMTL